MLPLQLAPRLVAQEPALAVHGPDRAAGVLHEAADAVVMVEAERVAELVIHDLDRAHDLDPAADPAPQPVRGDHA
jgi:hypothetical protein